jgi:hypothetical protein
MRWLVLDFCLLANICRMFCVAVRVLLVDGALDHVQSLYACVSFLNHASVLSDGPGNDACLYPRIVDLSAWTKGRLLENAVVFSDPRSSHRIRR